MSKERMDGVLPSNRQPADLVEIGWQLLEASKTKANALDKSVGYTEESRRNAKVVLGFLNSTINAFNSSMQMFKMSNLPQRVAVIKSALKAKRKK